MPCGAKQAATAKPFMYVQISKNRCRDCWFLLQHTTCRTLHQDGTSLSQNQDTLSQGQHEPDAGRLHAMHPSFGLCPVGEYYSSPRCVCWIARRVSSINVVLTGYISLTNRPLVFSLDWRNGCILELRLYHRSTGSFCNCGLDGRTWIHFW